ncbi:hypothetical protein F5880DRAFT_1624774 [Lentinula raphanica]|nr:hypothetical protein F5880DRAFT_1624774 [Lentinula raphanica]
MPQSIELPRIRTSFSNQALFLTEDRLSPVSRDISGLFAQTDNYDQSELEKIHPPWKRDLYALLEQPNSSVGAFLVHFLMTFFILLSAVVTVLETVPAFHSINPQICAIPTVEYLARCTAWSSSWSGLLKWMISFYGVIDLLSVLPYYIEVIMQQDTAVFFRFSILRMFRLVRVFRPFRYNHTILLTIEVMYLSVRRSRHALLAISFFVIMILTIFSTLLYFAERGTWDTTLETFINSDGDPTQFAWLAINLSLTAITTVGYGEITPRSFLGRLVTLPLLVFGLLLIALPSFVLGREFSIVWEKMTTQQSYQKDDDHDIDSPVELRSAPPVRPDREISTRKLALNQAELSRQISELRTTVEAQSEMIQQLLDLLEARTKGKQRAT